MLPRSRAISVFGQNVNNTFQTSDLSQLVNLMGRDEHSGLP